MADKSSSVCNPGGSLLKEDEHKSMDSATSILQHHANRGGKKEAPTGQSCKPPSPSPSKDMCWETMENPEEISCFEKPSLPKDVADEKDKTMIDQNITDLFAENHKSFEAKVISDSEEILKSRMLTDPVNGLTEKGKETLHMTDDLTEPEPAVSPENKTGKSFEAKVISDSKEILKSRMLSDPVNCSTEKGNKAMNVTDDFITPEPAVLPENKTGKKDKEMTEQEKDFEEVFGDLEDIIILPKLGDALFDVPWWRYEIGGASSDYKRGASPEPLDFGNPKHPKLD